MSLYYKIKDLFFPDPFENKLERLSKESKYPISEYQAFKIAEKNKNLKTDYYKNASTYITYLDFTNCKTKLLTDKNTNNTYWHITITEGEFSSISTDENGNTTYIDGILIKDDEKLLQCLVNVNTGEYTYCPNFD